MSSNAKRTYFALLGVTAMLTIGVFASLFFCVSILGTYADKLVEVKLENRVLDEQQAFLTSATKEIAQYSELNKIARAVVPQDKDQAEAVRTISTMASELGIALSGISFPPSTLGQSSSTKQKATETQVTPVKGLKGVYELQITVQSDTSAPITYQRFLEFLEKLESNRRTAQVATITILPSNTDRTKLTFNLVLSTYIRP